MNSKALVDQAERLGGMMPAVYDEKHIRKLGCMDLRRAELEVFVVFD